MKYYAIGQIVNNIASHLGITMNYPATAEVLSAPADSFYPLWLLPDNQAQALHFSFSTTTLNGVVANDLYFWYQLIDGSNHLSWSTAINGSVSSDPHPLPSNPTFLSVSILMQNDTIIVGTVDALIEEPEVTS